MTGHRGKPESPPAVFVTALRTVKAGERRKRGREAEAYAHYSARACACACSIHARKKLASRTLLIHNLCSHPVIEMNSRSSPGFVWTCAAGDLPVHTCIRFRAVSSSHWVSDALSPLRLSPVKPATSNLATAISSPKKMYVKKQFNAAQRSGSEG